MHSDLKQLSRFIIENRDEITINHERKVELLNGISTLSKTPISDVFNNYKDKIIDMFSLIDLSSTSNIPDLLFWKHFNTDVKIVKQLDKNIYNSLCTFREYQDKVIYNITDILSTDKTKIANNHSILKIISRDLCSRSYFNYSEMWLTGKLLRELCALYSMSISATISRIYNFDYQEQAFIATIFAYYFSLKCIKDNDDVKSFVISMTELGDRMVIRTTLSRIDENLEEDGIELNNQTNLIKVLKGLSPKRIDNMTVKVFNTIGRNFNLDQISSIISLEYPPYWLYNVLCAISGDKSNLAFTFKRLNTMKKAIEFGKSLVSDKAFRDSIF
jgi:hypothetical protein